MTDVHRQHLMTAIHRYGAIRFRQGMEASMRVRPEKHKVLSGRCEKALANIDRHLNHFEWQTIHDTEEDIDNG